ncbi:MAG TPA: SDR family oxidoreductase [Candidatus Marinimicrobia bacterium]|nr:SDR family oxidoreductase [Candidatus Neomarinimicrobiota bacterium]
MKKPWAVILGASSGFGGAAAIAFAKDGYNLCGVHLDRRATLSEAEKVIAEIEATGAKAFFYNVNAVDDQKRREVIAALEAELKQRGEKVKVLLHSLAFGALKPLFAETAAESLSQKQIEMTLDVMANSLVYWTQELYWAGLFANPARIYAMTSAGSHLQWSAYGAVSAAKAALESYCRQITYELAGKGLNANAIMAGVTDTPALRKIPGNDEMIAQAQARNPSRRLTTPEDVATALVNLSKTGSHWIAGNVLRVDGGEDIAG